MSSSFKDKVIAITGAGNGIGLALAHQLAAQGASLSVADVDKAAIEAAGRALAARGVKVVATQVDVAERAQVDAWIADTVAALGRLDGAANLAGIFRHSGPVHEIVDDDWDAVIRVNLTGVRNCMRAELNTMYKAEAGGSIVNAASLAGLRGANQFGAYVASKHAVLGLTRTAATEAGPKGVRVNAVCPSIIETTMVTNVEEQLGRSLSVATVPLGRRGQPEEVAKLITFLLSDDSSYITGSSYNIDGGLTA